MGGTSRETVKGRWKEWDEKKQTRCGYTGRQREKKKRCKKDWEETREIMRDEKREARMSVWCGLDGLVPMALHPVNLHYSNNLLLKNQSLSEGSHWNITSGHLVTVHCVSKASSCQIKWLVSMFFCYWHRYMNVFLSLSKCSAANYRWTNVRMHY